MAEGVRTEAESGPRLLVVMPARNEEDRIAGVIHRIQEVIPAATILVIEDSSHDDTVAVAREAGALVISLPINIGYGGALQAGFQHAAAHGFTTVVAIDADGQHSPDDIPRLLQALEQARADLVIGSRFVEDTGYETGPARRATMVFFALLTSLLAGQRITDTTSGFQAMGPKALCHFARRYPNDYPNAEVLVDLAWRGGRIVEVPIRVRSRSGGTSMFNMWSSLYYVVKMTLSVLMVPMRGRRPG